MHIWGGGAGWFSELHRGQRLSPVPSATLSLDRHTPAQDTDTLPEATQSHCFPNVGPHTLLSLSQLSSRSGRCLHETWRCGWRQQAALASFLLLWPFAAAEIDSLSVRQGRRRLKQSTHMQGVKKSRCRCTLSVGVALLQADLLPVCRELGIGVLAYSPLGRGLLTGQLKDLSQLHPSDFRTKLSPQFEAENHKHECRAGGMEGGLLGWARPSCSRTAQSHALVTQSAAWVTVATGRYLRVAGTAPLCRVSCPCAQTLL